MLNQSGNAMARLEPEEFSGKDISRIYVACRLPEAKQVEQILCDNSINYIVEIEEILRYILGIPRHRKAAAFYVEQGEAALSRETLLDAGLGAGIVDEE